MLHQDAIKQKQQCGQNQWRNSLSLDGHISKRCYRPSNECHTGRAEKRFSTYPKTTHCSNRVKDFSQRNWQNRAFSRNQKSANQLEWRNHYRRWQGRRFSSRERQQFETETGVRVPLTTLQTCLPTAETGSQWIKPLPKFFYQPIPTSGASGLPKIKLTEFSGHPLEWPKWSGRFDVVAHQKPISDTERCYTWRQISRVKQKQQYREWDSVHNHTTMLEINSVRSMQIRCHSQCSIQEITYSSSSSAWRFYEHRQNCKCGCKCGKHFDSNWILIRTRIRRRAKFNNEKTSTERTVVAVYARSSTTESRPDCYQRMAFLQSSNSWELVSTDKLVGWQKQFLKPW